MLLNVVDGISWCEDFGFVNVIHSERFEDLGANPVRDVFLSLSDVEQGDATHLTFDEVPYSSFGHYRDRHSVDDLLDHPRI